MSKQKPVTPPKLDPAPALSAPAATRQPLRQWVISLGLLAALTLMMFADVLFSAGSTVLSNSATDIFLEYSHWREFGFSELRHGNFPLWDPHLFCGAPYFGGAQAALLYPPNVLFLFLPLNHAINWSIALHVFLAGTFTYAWAAKRGLRATSCFLSAAIYMFCGANFLHIYSGYLSFICGFVWAPLLFLAIDGLFEKPSLGWSLAGMVAVAMQVLAGNPQSLFYTAVAAGIYCVLCVFRAHVRVRFILGLAGIVIGGVALSAVQVFAGLDEWREMLRSSGVPYPFAAMFSFPPENLITLIVPHFLGDVTTVSYWGRCYLWEVSLFAGVTGLILGIVGTIWGDSRVRRFSLVMICVLFVLALGAHTPLFHVLYDWVPGFNKFRGNSKFVFLASLFLALLAGVGFDQLVRGRRLPRYFVGAVAVFGVVLLGTGLLAHPAPSSNAMSHGWQSLMAWVGNLGESYLPADAYSRTGYVLGAARMASRGLMISGLTMLLIAVVLWPAKNWRLAPQVLLGLAVAELFTFARLSLDRFDLRLTVNPAISTFLEQHPGDYRIADLDHPNSALSLRAQDVWGYEPGVVLRYAQLIAFARGIPPGEEVLLTTLDDVIQPDSPLLTLLRCRFIFAKRGRQESILENKNYLPHALLVSRVRLLQKREQIFSALCDRRFNPSREVVLESPPDPAPVASDNPGTVRVTDFTSDSLGIEAEVRTPAILLVPDVYAKGWRARALPGSSQSGYQMLPADWCLRAIPLNAGHHLIRMEYSPVGFRIGMWISLASLLSFFCLAGLFTRRFLRDGGLKRLSAWPEPRQGALANDRDSPPLVGDGRVPLLGVTALLAALGLILWPVVGGGFLNYGSAIAPMLVLFLVVAWAALRLGVEWRQEKWRQLALAVPVVALLVLVVARAVHGGGNTSAVSVPTPPASGTNPVAADAAGDALLRQGRFDEAIGYFQQVLKTNPVNATAHQRLGFAFLRKKNTDEAISQYMEAVRLDPTLGEAHATLANLLLEKGLVAEALSHGEAAIAAQPGNPYYFNNQAWILATTPESSLRNGPRALQLATEANRMTGAADPSILETLAAAEAEAGQLSNAVATVERALQLAREHTNTAQIRALEGELRLYQDGKPWRLSK